MSIDIGISIIELEGLRDIDRKTHYLPNNEGIYSDYYNTYQTCYWSSSNLIENKYNILDTNDKLHCSYSLNKNYHFLTHTYISFYTGEWEIKDCYKDKVEIALTKNFGHNYIKEALFKIDDEPINRFDNIDCDFYFSFNHKNFDCKAMHEKKIGNIKVLNSFSDYIPNYGIYFKQPFFYCYREANAFPLFLFNSQVKFTHEYFFRKIEDLIRLRIKHKNPETGKEEWYYAKSNFIKENFKEYIKEKHSQMKPPNLFSEYIHICDEEHKMHGCNFSKELEDIKKIKLNYKQLYNPRIENSKNVSFCDLDANKLCAGLIWSALNEESLDYNIYSNYTNRIIDDEKKGKSPIISNTLKYKGHFKLLDLFNDHFTVMQPMEHFTSIPYNELIFCYAHGSSPFSPYADSALFYSTNGGSTLSCSLIDTNENINTVYIESEDDAYRKKKKVVYKVLSSKNKHTLEVRMICLETYSPENKKLNINKSNN
jgi:hypothetical protein